MVLLYSYQIQVYLAPSIEMNTILFVDVNARGKQLDKNRVPQRFHFLYFPPLVFPFISFMFTFHFRQSEIESVPPFPQVVYASCECVFM